MTQDSTNACVQPWDKVTRVKECTASSGYARDYCIKVIVGDSCDGKSYDCFDDIYHKDDSTGFAAQHAVCIGETGIFAAMFADVYPGHASNEVRGLNHAENITDQQTNYAKQE